MVWGKKTLSNARKLCFAKECPVSRGCDRCGSRWECWPECPSEEESLKQTITRKYQPTLDLRALNRWCLGQPLSPLRAGGWEKTTRLGAKFALVPLAIWDMLEKGLSPPGASPSHPEPGRRGQEAVSWQGQSSARGTAPRRLCSRAGFRVAGCKHGHTSVSARGWGRQSTRQRGSALVVDWKRWVVPSGELGKYLGTWGTNCQWTSPAFGHLTSLGVGSVFSYAFLGDRPPLIYESE